MKVLFLMLIASITFTKSTFASLPKVLIKNCYDGDTCSTLKGETIRLACIDTPELKGRKANPIPAKSAKNFLNTLVANQEVSIKRITKDRYGRTVAELFKDDDNVLSFLNNNNISFGNKSRTQPDELTIYGNNIYYIQRSGSSWCWSSGRGCSSRGNNE